MWFPGGLGGPDRVSVWAVVMMGSRLGAVREDGICYPSVVLFSNVVLDRLV